MIFPLKRNFRDKIFEVSQDFSRGACEGPKFSRIKFSRPDKNPRNPRKFSPSKILGYKLTVYIYSYIYVGVNCSYSLIEQSPLYKACFSIKSRARISTDMHACLHRADVCMTHDNYTT